MIEISLVEGDIDKNGFRKFTFVVTEESFRFKNENFSWAYAPLAIIPNCIKTTEMYTESEQISTRPSAISFWVRQFDETVLNETKTIFLT